MMNGLKLTIACISLATLASCSGCAAGPADEREMNYLASALSKVAAAVDAKVRFEGLPDGLSSEVVLEEATKNDPGLLKSFDGRVLRVLRIGEDTAVLVCEAGPGRALLEDAGCTAKMDSHRWSAPATQQCEFTLNISALCAN